MCTRHFFIHSHSDSALHLARLSGLYSSLPQNITSAGQLPASSWPTHAVVGQRFLEFSLYGCKHCTHCTWSIGTKCRRSKQLHAITSLLYGHCILIDDQLGLLDVTWHCISFLPDWCVYIWSFFFFFEFCYIPLNRHIWKAVYCIHFARPIMFWYLYLISRCRLSFWTNICKNFVLMSYWNLFWPEFPFTWSLSHSFSNLRNCATWFLVFPTWQRHVSVPWVW